MRYAAFAAICLMPAVLVSGGSASIRELDFRNALTIAMERNLELVKKRVESDFRRMAAGETTRAYYPRIGVSFNRAVTVRPFEADSRQYRYELSIEQLLFDGGKTANTRRLAVAEWRIAQKMLQEQERAVRLQVLSGFTKVIGGRRIKALNEEHVAIARKELELAEIEVKHGSTTPLDKEEIATGYESAQLELIRSDESLRIAQIAFNKLLRFPVDAEVRLVGDIEDGFEALPLVHTEEQLYEYARALRADFIGSIIRYQSALFEYENIKNSWLPDVSLSAKLFVSGPELFPSERGHSISINFSFPFFGSPVSASSSVSGGDDRTGSGSLSLSPFQDISYIRRIAETKTAAYFAGLERRELPDDVRREIRTTMIELDLARRKFDIRKRQLQTLRKRIEILELKIKLGESRRLDLSKAYIELYKMLNAQMEEIVEYANAAFRMEASAGLMPGSLKLFRSNLFTFE